MAPPRVEGQADVVTHLPKLKRVTSCLSQKHHLPLSPESGEVRSPPVAVVTSCGCQVSPGLGLSPTLVFLGPSCQNIEDFSGATEVGSDWRGKAGRSAVVHSPAFQEPEK